MYNDYQHSWHRRNVEGQDYDRLTLSITDLPIKEEDAFKLVLGRNKKMFFYVYFDKNKNGVIKRKEKRLAISNPLDQNDFCFVTRKALDRAVGTYSVEFIVKKLTTRSEKPQGEELIKATKRCTDFMNIINIMKLTPDGYGNDKSTYILKSVHDSGYDHEEVRRRERSQALTNIHIDKFFEYMTKLKTPISQIEEILNNYFLSRLYKNTTVQSKKKIRTIQKLLKALEEEAQIAQDVFQNEDLTVCLPNDSNKNEKGKN